MGSPNLCCAASSQFQREEAQKSMTSGWCRHHGSCSRSWRDSRTPGRRCDVWRRTLGGHSRTANQSTLACAASPTHSRAPRPTTAATLTTKYKINISRVAIATEEILSCFRAHDLPWAKASSDRHSLLRLSSMSKMSAWCTASVWVSSKFNKMRAWGALNELCYMVRAMYSTHNHREWRHEHRSASRTTSHRLPSIRARVMALQINLVTVRPTLINCSNDRELQIFGSLTEHATRLLSLVQNFLQRIRQILVKQWTRFSPQVFRAVRGSPPAMRNHAVARTRVVSNRTNVIKT